jgi:uncharacterized RDD family membrane protein YckC
VRDNVICSRCGGSASPGNPFCRKCGYPITGYNVRTSSSGEASLPPSVVLATSDAGDYAGFGARVAAYFIDFLILFVCFGVFVLVLMTTEFGSISRGRGSTVGVSTGSAHIASVLEFWGFVGFWLYFASMECSSWQATLGKKAMGLYVTDLAGQRIGFLRASVRYFAKMISSLVLFLGYLMAAFTEKRQALHDMIAGCLVQRRI